MIKHKSKSSCKKRFIIKKNKKIKFKHSNLRHNLTKKSKKYKLVLRKKEFINKSIYNKLKKKYD